MAENFFQTDLLKNGALSLSALDYSTWELSDRGVRFFGQLTFAIEALSLAIIILFLLVLFVKFALAPENSQNGLLAVVTIVCGLLLFFGIHLTLNISRISDDEIDPPSRASKIFLSVFNDSWNLLYNESRLRHHVGATAICYLSFAIEPSLTLFLFLIVFAIVVVVKFSEWIGKRKTVKANGQTILN
jgi:hypothetical protein